MAVLRQLLMARALLAWSSETNGFELDLGRVFAMLFGHKREQPAAARILCTPAANPFSAGSYFAFDLSNSDLPSFVATGRCADPAGYAQSALNFVMRPVEPGFFLLQTKYAGKESA